MTAETTRARANCSGGAVTRPEGRTAAKPLRCAIYTRKSTENGLEQAFNSLDNQRESAEAYIKSQAHEGWRQLPDHYDDGGFSGGSLDRPAVQRLLAEVRAGRVDVIVVYKVDRLTRSLSDFAKLVELFDEHGVSFVSVTQAFNTTTSMGRLTLNVLLSFAQFEREVTGERIRDKIAASKKKGMRMGGPVALGYQVQDKKLVPDPTEAATVNLIFRRYLELGSLRALLADLHERGIITKANLKRDGSVRGTVPFDRGGLAYLLKNRTYIGEVVHKGRHYPGQHEPIVAQELFDAVQAELAERARNTGAARLNADALLKGLFYDHLGRRMLPTMSKKGGARYRYYASSTRQSRGRGVDAEPIIRVAAPEIEAVVLQALGIDGSLQQTSACNADTDAQPTAEAQILSIVERIQLGRGELEIVFRSDDGQPAPSKRVPWSTVPNRRRRAIIGVEQTPTMTVRPIRAETRARLLSGIANARAWLDELASGRIAGTKEIAAREHCSERGVRLTLNLAFLSPAIMQAAVAGTLPDGAGVVAMTEMPIDWTMQTRSMPHC